jgi:hypothetical protein
VHFVFALHCLCCEFTKSCKAKSPWEFAAAGLRLEEKQQPVQQSGVIFSRFRPQPREALSKKRNG